MATPLLSLGDRCNPMQLCIVKPIQTQQDPKMKSCKTLVLLLLGGMLSTAAMAGDEKTAVEQQTAAIQQLWKQLNKNIRLEKDFRQAGLDAVVEVDFVVAEDGRMVVEQISGADAAIRSSVTRQLESMQLRDFFWLANQRFSVPIRLLYR